MHWETKQEIRDKDQDPAQHSASSHNEELYPSAPGTGVH